MSANDSTATTAIERARLAYEQMKRRQYEAIAQKRARDRSRNIKLAASAAGMIALFVGFAIYNGSPPPDPLRSSTDQAANQTNNSKFGETRTAPIRSFVKGNTCQEIHFNNDAGTYARGSLVPCVNESSRDAAVPLQSSSAAPSSPSKGPRINAIRDGFK